MDDRAGATCVAPPTQDLLNAAMGAHHAGRLEEAGALYRHVLAADEANAAALHLLGVVCQQQGDAAQAIELIGRAAALRPDVPVIQAGLAEALLAAGRHAEAVACARTALRLGADDPAVRWVLGQALDALGQHEEAIRHLVDAVRQKPDFGAAFNSLGNAVRAIGRPEEAKGAYHAAIRVAPALAAPYFNLGSILLEEGRYTDAHGPLERAVELEPGRAEFWEGLADVYERLDRFDAAVPCRERVLALTGGSSAGPHVALAQALRRENRPDDAHVHLQRAVALEPASGDARFHLGVYDEEQGDFDQAEVRFREALERQPEHDLARARLATLRRDSLDEDDLDALERRVADGRVDPEARARLLFALGQVHDARREYPQAAARLREANALHASLARGARKFRAEVLERFVDQTIDAFTPAFFARMAGAGLETRSPVFIVGLPRSGTTLIEQIVSSHPQAHGAGELSLAWQTFDLIPSQLGADASPTECVPHLNPILIRSLAGLYFQQLRALSREPRGRIVDKMPENYKHLGFLHALFPCATIIHCRRDLRDVALSCWMADFLNVVWASDPAHIAASFRAYQRLMDHWNAVLPATIHTVDYEETIDDLEGTARRLIAALGLEWDPACLEFHRNPRTIRTGSIHQVRRPLYRGSVGRWKRYEHELAELFAALPQAG